MKNIEEQNSIIAVKLTLLISTAMTMMAFAPLSPALPLIAETFSDSKNVQYLSRVIFTIPSITIVLVAPFSGILIDKIGRKKILLFSIFLYGFSGTYVYWIDSIQSLLISRIIMGFALSGIMTASTTLSGDYFAGKERQKFMSLRGAFVNYAAVLFNIIGGFLVSINWRMAFLLYSAAFLFIPFAAYIIKKDLNNKLKNTKDAIILKSLKYKLIFLGFGMNILFNVAFFMVPVQIPFFLHELGNFNPIASGLTTGTSAFAVATSSLFFFKLRKNLNSINIFILGTFFVTSGFVILSQITTLNYIYPCIILSGIGFGLLQANMYTWVLDNSTTKVRGKISGGLAATTFGGQFLSPIINEPIAASYGMNVSFLIIGILIGSIGIILILLKNKINQLTN